MAYEPRTYRRTIEPSGLVCFQVVVAETDLQICAERDLSQAAEWLVREVRSEIEAYISTHPRFAEAYAPHPVEPGSPGVIGRMAYAGSVAGVGPMAAVAGAVAEHVARGLAVHSSEVIVENGGDIFILGRQRRTVALATSAQAPARLALEIEAAVLPCAIATSSGTLGHSTSFGAADAVTVIAADGALADAVATALANRIREPGDISGAIEVARQVAGVLGVLASVGETVGAWGAVRLAPLAEDKGMLG